MSEPVGRVGQIQAAMEAAGIDAVLLRLAENIVLTTHWYPQIPGLALVVIGRSGGATLLLPDYEASEASETWSGDIRTFPAIRHDPGRHNDRRCSPSAVRLAQRHRDASRWCVARAVTRASIHGKTGSEVIASWSASGVSACQMPTFSRRPGTRHMRTIVPARLSSSPRATSRAMYENEMIDEASRKMAEQIVAQGRASGLA